MQVLVVLLNLGVSFEQLADFTLGVENRGVISAAKGVTDFGQTHPGELLGQRHSDLTGAGDLPVSAFRV